MKNIFKKNNIIITFLAIMLAVAGYLNFSKEDVINTANETEESATYAETDVSDFGLLDLSDEDLAAAGLTVDDNGEVADVDEIGEEGVVPDGETTADADEVVKEGEVADTVATDEVADAADEGVGEAVMVSNTISSDYFASARLNREQSRAKSKELLLEIVNNENLSEAQKDDAVASIERLASIAEKESATENLLEAKGFTDVVVSIVDESVDVIVNANELTDQQMAQIEDIVKRKTEASAQNIVITPVAVTKN